ncbi:MAG: hypothetical protein K0A99_08370 [Desulfoarculaceae bacterium]|nr:hypothetical protein [Desulfoarculaceae bacterium]
MKNKLWTVFAAVFLFMFSAEEAHAYLDPGTGSAILQGVLGALAAIAVVLKLYWHRLLKMLGLRKDTKDSSLKSTEKTTKD